MSALFGSKQAVNHAAASSTTPARRAFAHAWQGWVQVILTEHADDPVLIEVTA